MHSTSVRGFGGKNDIKTEQMIKIIEEMSTDMIMLNNANCKWNTITIENLRHKFSRVIKKSNMIT